MTIEITILDEEVSYIVDEPEDCRNEIEREAFLLCEKHGKAICIGKTIAAPSSW
jgi:translation initiation factor 2 beta subunit (eIF-2beta)/eIF-5